MTGNEDADETASHPGKPGERLSSTDSPDGPEQGRARELFELAGASRDRIDPELAFPVSSRIGGAARGAA